MAIFGRGKKHKKGKKQKTSENRRRFAEIEDYGEDEAYYEDDESAEYGDGEYYGEDESAEYGDEEYYGDGESAEYGDEEYYEDDESEEYGGDGYYGDDESEEYGDEEYYGEDESEEYGDEEYYEEEYYGDDVDYYENNTRYENGGEEEDDDDLFYMDGGEYEDGYDDEDDEDDFVAYRKKRGVAGAFLAFRNMPFIDKVIALTGVAVLAFAVVTGTVFMAARKEDRAVAAFAEVGTSLMGVGIIGESGLLAVADAQLAKEAMAEQQPEQTGTEGTQWAVPEKPQTPEPDPGVDVTIKMTSIVKDLKIKFLNQKTDKLVANVPFEVEAAAPGGKTEVWIDDDKDGIIYKENIESGAYSVKMLPLAGFDKYRFSTENRSVEVKADITYKKVDVKEEIKTEAEVNAAVEDTVIPEVVEESKLTDTVPFVASTGTKSEVSYREVDKGTLVDPATTSASIRGAAYYLMTAQNKADVSGDDVAKPDDTKKPDDTAKPKEPEEPEEPVPVLSISGVSVEVGKEAEIKIDQKENVEKIIWTSGDTAKVKVDASGKVTGVAEGEVKITATGVNKKGDKTATATCMVKVTPAPVTPTLKIDHTEITLAVGESGTIKAESNQEKVSWEASGSEFADVSLSVDGKTVTLKAKKAGTVTLKATVKDLPEQTCTVKVVDTSANADKDSVQIVIKKTAEIKVATVPESAVIDKVVSSNTDIATVSYKDKTVTVTGVARGDTEVLINCSNGREVKLPIKVLNSYESDTTSLLKDKDGRQVFVQQGDGQYRQAKYADYYDSNIKKFYIEESTTLYTGWQHIDGKTYYYLEDHKFVTGEQIIQGAKYNFASDGSLVTSAGEFGIDVSKWNGNIDWNSVKSSGAAYAVIRCGYRGSKSGALITDPKFAANISGASTAGLKVGVYFFTQAVNEKEAVEEASMVLDLVRKYAISYPIFLDVESSGGRADKIDKATRTAVCRAFCATIQDSGYTAGIYANKTWLSEKMDLGALGGYKIWLAQYAAAPDYNGRYDLWQYSAKGSVPGISGKVDLNLSYLGY